MPSELSADDLDRLNKFLKRLMRSSYETMVELDPSYGGLIIDGRNVGLLRVDDAGCYIIRYEE